MQCLIYPRPLEPKSCRGDEFCRRWLYGDKLQYIYWRQTVCHHGDVCVVQWASYQIRKTAGCACAGNAGNVFPTTDFKGNVRDARAVMHVEIAYPRWRGKRSRHSRRMLKPQFYVSGKRPMTGTKRMYEWSVGDIAKVAITLTIVAVEHAYAQNDNYSQEETFDSSSHPSYKFVSGTGTTMVNILYLRVFYWMKKDHKWEFLAIPFTERKYYFPAESNCLSSTEDIKYRYKHDKILKLKA